MRGALAIAVAVLATAVACGGSNGAAPDEEPGAFLARLLKYEFSGQFHRSYDLLHPGHQALVTRSRYDECSQDDIGSVTLQGVEELDVYDDPISVPDIPEKTSKAVTLRLTLLSGGETEHSTHTFHAVLVNGRWAWFLQTGSLEAYRVGECPP
jgi:hypothetical protein